MAAKAFDTKILPKKEAYDISSGFETVPVTAEEEAIMVNNFQVDRYDRIHSREYCYEFWLTKFGL